MKMLLSCLLTAYVLTGIEYVAATIHAQNIDKPLWAVRPSIGIMIIAVALWPLFKFLERSPGALLILITQIFDYVVFVTFLWVLNFVCHRFFSGLIASLIFGISVFIFIIPMRFIRSIILIIIFQLIILFRAMISRHSR